MKQKTNKLYCFSPPVMMATFLLELGMAAYVLLKYRMSRVTRLVATLLVCLATFQLAEYFVCGGLGVNAPTWSRIGYAAITVLPSLGLHLTHAIAKKPMGRITVLAYTTSALWLGLFMLSPQAFTGYTCGGNYVIFQLQPPIGGLFFIHYYIWLFVTMYFASSFARKAKLSVRKALKAQILSYAAFIIPTSTINLLWPHTAMGLPSIMCGFAVIFAISLTIYVMPLENERSEPLEGRMRN